MRNFQFTRALALLLSLVLILSCLGSLRLPSAADEPAPDAIVVACSDFQNFEDSNGGGYTGSYTNNLALVNGILDAMDYPAIDGFVCGGDYNFTETMNRGTWGFSTRYDLSTAASLPTSKRSSS